jgi:Na+/phosphate symporter
MFALTTSDPNILSKHLQQIDKAWIGGGLYFIGGQLFTQTTFTAKSLDKLYDLVKSGIVERK